MAEGYTVTSQRQTVDLGSDGRFRQVMEISFTDAHDNHGQILVPLSQYSADHVRDLLDARVAEMHAVHTL